MVNRLTSSFPLRERRTANPRATGRRLALPLPGRNTRAMLLPQHEPANQAIAPLGLDFRDVYSASGVGSSPTLVWAGVEPATSGSLNRRSTQLSDHVLDLPRFRFPLRDTPTRPPTGEGNAPRARQIQSSLDKRRRWESNPLQTGLQPVAWPSGSSVMNTQSQVSPPGHNCPRQESNLGLDLRTVGCIRHTPGTCSQADSTLARNRTWPSAFGEPHASTTIRGPSFVLFHNSAGAQGFEPCARVLEARCSPRSTPRSNAGYPPGIEPGASGLTTPVDGHVADTILPQRKGRESNPQGHPARPPSKRVPSPIG